MSSSTRDVVRRRRKVLNLVMQLGTFLMIRWTWASRPEFQSVPLSVIRCDDLHTSRSVLSSLSPGYYCLRAKFWGRFVRPAAAIVGALDDFIRAPLSGFPSPRETTSLKLSCKLQQRKLNTYGCEINIAVMLKRKQSADARAQIYYTISPPTPACERLQMWCGF